MSDSIILSLLRRLVTAAEAATIVPALDALPPQLMSEFHVEFGAGPFEAYLLRSGVCMESEIFHPCSKDAWLWFAANAGVFFNEWGISVGEVRKTRRNG